MYLGLFTFFCEIYNYSQKCLDLLTFLRYCHCDKKIDILITLPKVEYIFFYFSLEFNSQILKIIAFINMNYLWETHKEKHKLTHIYSGSQEHVFLYTYYRHIESERRRETINNAEFSQNGGNKNTKHAKFSEKRTVFTPWYAHVSEGKKRLFFRKFGVLCILVTSV